MRKLRASLIGVETGSVELFSDFKDDGPMWTGSGPREREVEVLFSEAFRSVPEVQISVGLWDMDNGAPARIALAATAITRDGFTAQCRTWGDTRIARMTVTWMAIGEARNKDDWEV